MNPVRLTTVAAVGREVVLPVGVALWLAAFGSAALDNKTGVTRFINHFAPSLTANAEFAAKRQAIAPEPLQAVVAEPPQAIATEPPQAVVADQPKVAVTDNSDMVAANAVVTGIASDTSPPREAEPVVTAALTAPSETLPEETPPSQAATAIPANPESSEAKQVVGTVEVLDECYVMETCIDRYLWALYQRTPKEDSVKESEQRRVTVKRKGKLVTVTRTTTSVVDEDFAWKDPKAADKAGMSMTDYVIGGMDQGFKQRLFRMLLAAEQAGLSPGITSAFRDDYRQSIASGLKAASDRSYHGGSFRGGYGHGLAADVVSTKGDTRAQRQASSEAFWRWIDVHGKDFGIGRPYHDHDPPHVGPIDGLEYVSRHPAKRVQPARAEVKKPPVSTQEARAEAR
jgi:hypothetical protein